MCFRFSSRPLGSVRFVPVLAAATVLGLACSAPAPSAPASPPASPITPTRAPAQATAAPAKPSAVASPAASPVVAGSPVARGGGTRLALVDGASEARFRAREQLAGQSLFSDAVGATKNVTGQVVLDNAGKIDATQSKVTVDLRTLKSDESRRDNFIQRNPLETTKFPTAEFTPREASGLPSSLPTSGSNTFKLSGDLTVHGAARPVVWDVTAHFAPDAVTGSASTPVTLQDFGMTPPRVPLVLSIEETLKLELDFKTTRSAA